MFAVRAFVVQHAGRHSGSCAHGHNEDRPAGRPESQKHAGPWKIDPDDPANRTRWDTPRRNGLRRACKIPGLHNQHADTFYPRPIFSPNGTAMDTVNKQTRTTPIESANTHKVETPPTAPPPTNATTRRCDAETDSQTAPHHPCCQLTGRRMLPTTTGRRCQCCRIPLRRHTCDVNDCNHHADTGGRHAWR